MRDFSGKSERPLLLRPRTSRGLKIWWLLLHGVLFFAVLLVSPSFPIFGLLAVVLAAHAWLRYPGFSGLVVLSPGGRFGLPGEGRFDLLPGARTRIGAFWVELAFDDLPGFRLLLLRDQFTDSAWRRLRIALDERN